MGEPKYVYAKGEGKKVATVQGGRAAHKVRAEQGDGPKKNGARGAHVSRRQGSDSSTPDADTRQVT